MTDEQRLIAESAAPATGRFTLEVGRLIAGQVEREIRRTAFEQGFELNIQKEMGLFDGVLLITVKGAAKPVSRYMRAIQTWVRQIDGPGGAT